MFGALRSLLTLMMVVLLAACINTGDRRQPIPTQLFAGAEPGRVLVVVLPGRWDDVHVMAEAGMPDAIRQAWPAADVLLTSATMAYYTDGGLAKRLHEQVIEPARARGYSEIWMAGASMGGMGTLLYERQYPGELQGLVLLAPYLGGRGVLKSISEAGGIAQWQPGPVPETMDRSNYQIELWRYLQTWVGKPEQGRRLWLAYGDDDRLRDAVPVLAPLLPSEQILVRPGGHTWEVWVPAAGEVFSQIAGRRTSKAGS